MWVALGWLALDPGIRFQLIPRRGARKTTAEYQTLRRGLLSVGVGESLLCDCCPRSRKRLLGALTQSLYIPSVSSSWC